LDALVAAAAGAHVAIKAILVTHGHPDHWPGAAPLRELTGARVYAHPAARFAHDVACADGEWLALGEIRLRVVHAPGHAVDHLVFYLPDEGVLFTGDVVVGRGTVVIAPPGGDMRAYQATLARLASEFAQARAIFGGHGERVDDPRAKLAEYIAHRAAREGELLDALRAGPQTIPQLVARIYATTNAVLWPAAARQLLAYLIALEREGRVVAHDLARPLTASEAAILEPDLRRMVDAPSAAVAAAELGLANAVPTLNDYALVSDVGEP
jgi:glyoxylase-like metal-dependent hydrolase (beta-lactamase superfamily II)